MNCKNCGRPLNEGAKFCPGCGQNVESPARGDTAAKLRDAAGGALKKPYLVPILAAVLILAVCVGVWRIFTRQDDSGEKTSHDYTYVTLGGAQYTGTYSGGWESGQPNGEGEFSGEGANGSISLAGSWSNGKPHGQCRRILKTDTYTQTYNGDYFYGERRGNGGERVEDLDGNLIKTYTGEFQDDQACGNGEMTYYFTEEASAKNGYDRLVCKGQFANDTGNGMVEWTAYYTAEFAASCGLERIVYIGQYSNDWTGEIQRELYFTSEYADREKYDTEVHTGQYKDGGLVEPYRYALCRNGKVVEEGRIKDGKYISDTEKALKDSVYDVGRDLAGDGLLGDLYDIFGPMIYDRNAD